MSSEHVYSTQTMDIIATHTNSIYLQQFHCRMGFQCKLSILASQIMYLRPESAKPELLKRATWYIRPPCKVWFYPWIEMISFNTAVHSIIYSLLLYTNRKELYIILIFSQWLCDLGKLGRKLFLPFSAWEEKCAKKVAMTITLKIVAIFLLALRHAIKHAPRMNRNFKLSRYISVCWPHPLFMNTPTQVFQLSCAALIKC